MKIEFLPVAELDLEELAEFWEQKSRALGLEFVEHIEAESERLCGNAQKGIYGKNVGDFFKFPTSRFSSVIFYQVHNEIIYIFAVFDLRSDPDWIIQQLQIR